MRTAAVRLRSLLGSAYNRIRYPRFHRLRREAGGMLPPMVYQRLYREVRRLPDLDVVEVGGAAGAGSIAIAQAMGETGKRARLILVERCELGSRAAFGGREENLARLRRHLEHFGVADRVVVYPHELTMENGAEVLALVSTPEIAAFIHDADGQIDRDFRLFWPRLREGGLIVVDDFVNLAEFRPVSERHPDGGTKCLRTFRLLNRFIEWGLFEPFAQVQSTVFGRKPPGADFSRFDPAICEAILETVSREREAALAASGEARA